MFDASSRKSGKRDRSLLSLGPAGRDADSGSLLSLARPQDADPALRHRLVRSRREAEASPLLAALASLPDAPEAVGTDHGGQQRGPAVDAPADRASQEPAGGIGAWLGRFRDRMDAPSPAAARSAVEVPAASSPRDPGRRETAPAEWQSAAPAPLTGEPAPLPEPAAVTRDDYWRPLIDPFQVIGGVVRSRWIIAAATIAGAVLGVLVALSTPKIYEAYAELVVDPRDLKLVDRELTTTGLPSDATLALVENQVRVLTSSTVLNKVVDRLGLDRDPEFNGEQGAFGPGAVIAMLRSFVSGRDDAADAVRRRALAVEHLGESLHVERGGKTFVIVISVGTRSGEKSALIANTMTDVFIQTTGELQSETAGRATEELMSRIGELRGEVEEAERKVAAFKAENDIVDSQGRLITDDEIVKVNDQLTVARARTIELNARAASARDLTVEAVVSGALPEELTSPVMTELRAQYAVLKQEADRVTARLGPRHPTRVDIEAQLAGARERLSGELRRLAASIQVELTRAVQQEQELAARLAQLKARHGSLGEDLVTLRELERDATAKRAVYEAFLLRARETQEQMSINAANVTVISTAFPPLDPSGPSRSTIAAGGTILGFMLGVGIGAARGAWASLRENMAGRPRRRRRARPAGDDAPPPPKPGGGRTTERRAPGTGSETGDDRAMGFLDRFRGAGATARRKDAAPVAGAAPPHPPAFAFAAPPQAQPPAAQPAPVPPPVHAVTGYAPVFAPPAPMWPQIPQPLFPQALAPSWYGVAQPVPAAPVAAHPAAGYGPWAYPPAPQPAAPLYPPAAPVYAQPAPPPIAPAAYGPPVHPAAHHAAAPVPPAAAPEPAAPAWPAEAVRRRAAEPRLVWSEPVSTVDEIRDSLREVRDAVRALAEERQRRRA